MEKLLFVLSCELGFAVGRLDAPAGMEQSEKVPGVQVRLHRASGPPGVGVGDTLRASKPSPWLHENRMYASVDVT